MLPPLAAETMPRNPQARRNLFNYADAKQSFVDLLTDPNQQSLLLVTAAINTGWVAAYTVPKP